MTFLGPITNPDNETLKYVRSLREKKRARYQEKRYMLEGLRLVAHALQRGYRPALAFYTEDIAATPEGQSLLRSLEAATTSLWLLTPELMATISDTVTPQGILAILPMREPNLEQLATAAFLLVLDHIHDPGNMGTMLRTAHAGGVEGALLSDGCVDPYSPKVVRAGMGAHLDLPVAAGLSWPEIGRVTRGKQCVLAEASGDVVLWDVDWTAPTALIIGSEAHGPGPEARELADITVRLPMTEGAESLNAAIAMAVLVFEALRQRRGQQPPA